MRFVFCEKDEKERDIICNVLDSWDVHYRIRTNRSKDLFFRDNSTYDVEINVEPAFYDYLNKEIDKVFDLEVNYYLPALSHPVCKEEDNTKEDSIISDLFKRSRHIEEDNRDSFASKLINTIKNKFEDGVQVDFEELPEDLKTMLLDKVPKEILTSKACKIIRTATGISVQFPGGPFC